MMDQMPVRSWTNDNRLLATKGSGASQLQGRKECPKCLLNRPQSEYRKDRRTRDGLARRCARCQKERDRRAYRRKRMLAYRAHRKWRSKPENRIKKAIRSEMWRNRYKPLPIMRRIQVYGPPWIGSREGRIAWLMQNQIIRSIRTPQQLIEFLENDGTFVTVQAYWTFSLRDYEFGRYAGPYVWPYHDKRRKEYKRMQNMGPPVCPVW